MVPIHYSLLYKFTLTESLSAKNIAVASAFNFLPPTMAELFNLQAVLNDTKKLNTEQPKKDDDSAATAVTGGKTKQKGPEMHQIWWSVVCTSDKGGILKDAATNVSCTFKLILEDFVDQVLMYDHNGKVITIIDNMTFASNAVF